MTKKRKTRSVDKSEYRNFLAKADDFASMLDLARVTVGVSNIL